MTKKLPCLLLALMMALSMTAVAESAAATIDEIGIHFTGAGSISTTYTADEDGLYLFFAPVQNYTGEEAQQVKVTCGEPALLPEETVITAEPGVAGRTFLLQKLSAGEYPVTFENLTGGAVDVLAILHPTVRLDTFSGATMNPDESMAYAVSLAEDTSFTFTLHGEENSFCAFFTDTDQSNMQLLMIPEGETEATATIDFPAGEAIVFFVQTGHVLTAE